ncbi:MAG: Flp family type IVb pilin [Rhizomicrobium sp.]
MGASARSGFLSDAAGRFAAHSDAARSAVSAFGSDTSGATAIEYAMVAGFLSVVIVGAVNTLGANVNTMFFSKIASMLNP